MAEGEGSLRQATAEDGSNVPSSCSGLLRKDRKGRAHPLRPQITNDPNALAEEGWEQEREDKLWTGGLAKKYVKMYHIDKLFPVHVHELHHRQKGVKAETCTHNHFVHRANEVHAVLFPGRQHSKGFIKYGFAAMLYAEVILKRTMDWRTVPMKRSVDKTKHPHPHVPDTYMGPTAEGSAHNGQRSPRVNTMALVEASVVGRGHGENLDEDVGAVVAPNVNAEDSSAENFEVSDVHGEQLRRDRAKKRRLSESEGLIVYRQYEVESQENENLRKEIAELEEFKLVVIQENSSQCQEIHALKRKLSDVKLEVDVLQSRNDKLKKANEAHIVDLTELRRHHRAYEKLEKELDVVRKERDELMDSIGDGQRFEVEGMMKTISGLRYELELLQVDHVVEEYTNNIVIFDEPERSSSLSLRESSQRRRQQSMFSGATAEAGGIFGSQPDTNDNLTLSIDACPGFREAVEAVFKTGSTSRGEARKEGNVLDGGAIQSHSSENVDFHEKVAIEVQRVVEETRLEEKAKFDDEVHKAARILLEGITDNRTAAFKDAVHKEVERRVEALVQTDSWKDVLTVAEQEYFDQKVSTEVMQRMDGVLKTSSGALESSQTLPWLNWAFNMDIRQNQIRQAKKKLALRASLSSEAATNINKGLSLFERVNRGAVSDNASITCWGSLSLMFERLHHGERGDNGSIDWGNEVEEEWAPYLTMNAAVDPDAKAVLRPGYAPKWMSDGTKCSMCLNPYGPEGVYVLGHCGHMFHVTCLLEMALSSRGCAECKAPLSRRFYELFGILGEMPLGYEYNRWNLPLDQEPHHFLNYRHWGKLMAWDPSKRRHTLYTSTDVDPLFWMTSDYEVETRASVMEDAPQRELFCRNFGGHWSSQHNRFFRFLPNPIDEKVQVIANADEITVLDEVRGMYDTAPIGRARFLFTLEEAAILHFSLSHLTEESTQALHDAKHAFEGRMNNVIVQWKEYLTFALNDVANLDDEVLDSLVEQINAAMSCYKKGEVDSTPIRDRKRRQDEGEDHSPQTLRQMQQVDRQLAERGGPSSSQRRTTRNVARRLGVGLGAPFTDIEDDHVMELYNE